LVVINLDGCVLFHQDLTDRGQRVSHEQMLFIIPEGEPGHIGAVTQQRTLADVQVKGLSPRPAPPRWFLAYVAHFITFLTGGACRHGYGSHDHCIFLKDHK
jgi:hypothetical protein